MVKHPLSSLIMGIILVLGGIVLILVSIFASFDDSWVTLIYGVPIFVIGMVLLVWKKEDDVEQRKDLAKVKGGDKK